MGELKKNLRNWKKHYVSKAMRCNVTHTSVGNAAAPTVYRWLFTVYRWSLIIDHPSFVIARFGVSPGSVAIQILQ